jgi:NAD(P)-dependent dehydrogenase (short-subunit alcohol dehydrogenase family)
VSDLEGRTVIVTGGARGIGRAIVDAVARDGANVVVNYWTSVDAAAALKAQLEEAGTQCEIVRANVAEEGSPQVIVRKALDRFGRIDCLVNNSGITRDAQLRKLDRDAYEEVIDTNLIGSVLLAKAVIEPMIEAGYGRIVNIASFVGQKGNFGQSNYAAAKGGLIAWTKTAALELARHNITVNAVAPGFTETDMLAKVREDVREKLMAQIPLRRFGLPEEVAHAVVFALTASYVTGAQIDVNGGVYM